MPSAGRFTVGGLSMSILANKDTRVVIQGGAAGVNAARRMAEFC